MDAKVPLILPFASWPDADRQLWERACSPGDLFDDDGSFAHLSDGSLKINRQGYAQWLSCLLRKDPDCLALPPTERVTEERVSAFIADARSRNCKDQTIARHLLVLMMTMRAFGGAPPDWLACAQKRICRLSYPTKLKKPSPVTAEELMAWALEKLRLHKEFPEPDPLVRAMRFRQALMVGVQIACPVRCRAMLAMTVDRHIHMQGAQVILRFANADMKTGRGIDVPLPAALVPAMKDYLDIHRPVLLRGNTSDSLWITQRGNPMNADSYHRGLKQLTEREFGVGLTPHAFRHIAATSIATKNPANAGIIRDVLGHATIRMSEQYYNRATSIDACARLQHVVDSARKPGGKKRKGSRGG